MSTAQIIVLISGIVLLFLMIAGHLYLIRRFWQDEFEAEAEEIIEESLDGAEANSAGESNTVVMESTRDNEPR